jgi:hypothetical protein
MPTKKIVSDVYTIRAPQVIIDGNLIVGGDATQTSIQNTNIQDKTIVLNDGETGAGITGVDQYSGIEIDRGTQPNVGVRFNEDPEGDGSESPAWQATNDGTNWKYLVLSTEPEGAGLQAVVEDTAPELGGNLNLAGFSLTDSTSNVEIYTGLVGGGGSGVFVNNDEVDNRELITKRKAVVYALIF